MKQIILSEVDVQSIINGREVKRTLHDGTEILVRQSYILDIAAPMMIDRYNVRDSKKEELLKQYHSSVKPLFEKGCYSLGWMDHAHKITTKDGAENIAKIIGGEVVPVEEETE